MNGPAVCLCTCCLMLVCAPAPGATLRVPDDHPDIRAAVGAASAGDVVKVGPGTFQGTHTIDKPITLSGAGRDRTILKVGKATAVEVRACVTIEHVTIESRGCGVLVHKGASVVVRHCRIVGAADGLHFAGDFNITAVVHHNQFVRCTDAIDLESTQAIIFDNEFRDSRDDAIDFDGDAGGIVFRNTITGCRDDGIEIRLSRMTQAVIVGNTFDTCGEDGVELIASPVKGERHNLVLIADNMFRSCRRYGVGEVRGKEEEATEARLEIGLFGSGNRFADCGRADVSTGVGPVDLRVNRATENVQVRMVAPDRTWQKALPVRALTPLAIIDLQHDPNGKRIADGEGVAIDRTGSCAFVADDNAHAIWVVDLRTAQIRRKLSTHPFPGSDVRVTGTEGLSLDPADAGTLWLADDDGKRVHRVSAGPDRLGRLLGSTDVRHAHRSPEGIAVARDVVYLVGGDQLVAADREDYRPRPGFPVHYRFKRYGSHVAGVTMDGGRLLMTASAYGGKTQYNDRGLLFAADPDTGEVTEVWSLGDYSSDPRGVAVRDGLVYVCDGYATPKLPSHMGPNRQGLKLYMFALEPVRDVEALLHRLPLRQKGAASGSELLEKVLDRQRQGR